MSTRRHSEFLHRTVKLVMDAQDKTCREATQWLRGLRLNIKIDSDDATSTVGQAALLSAVAMARRSFLGGVAVTGNLGVPKVACVPGPNNLDDAVSDLGGRIGDGFASAPTVFIGGPPRTATEGFGVRAAYRGWCGGVVPADCPFVVGDGGSLTLAGVLASALAVGEAFRFANGDGSAGQVPAGLNLWDPRRETDWLVHGDAPAVEWLPALLWLVGLGHLGQAFLWGLGTLPYGNGGGVRLVLQDDDEITASTESTSILSDSTHVGRLKTRVMASWAERRGFETRIVERRFDARVRPQADEPRIVLYGIDNIAGRRELNDDVFDLIVEAGLGAEHDDYDCVRMHSLPGPRTPREIWRSSEGTRVSRDAGKRGRERMLANGELDECGLVDLAGVSVGVPFVGTVAAAIGLAEILRILHGGPAYQVVDLSIRDIGCRQALENPRLGDVSIPRVAAVSAGP